MRMRNVKVIITSSLLIRIPLEPLNNYSNIEIVYCQISERCEIINFHRKTGNTQCRCCFFCLKLVLCMSLAYKHSTKHK